MNDDSRNSKTGFHFQQCIVANMPLMGAFYIVAYSFFVFLVEHTKLPYVKLIEQKNCIDSLLAVAPCEFKSVFFVTLKKLSDLYHL